MELHEVMRSVGSCRYFRDDPVRDEVLAQAVESARFAPQGGNRQGVRFIIVRDRAKKECLAEWYQELWAEASRDLQEAPAGESSLADRVHSRSMHSKDLSSFMRKANDFARNFANHPAIIVACVDLDTLNVTDADLDRPSIVGGGSVYPMIQNLLLALRDLGVGSALTTLLCAYEPRVQELLGIPKSFATAAHIAVGYPLHGFPRKLTRRPVEEIAFVDSFDNPLPVMSAGPVA